MTYNELIQNENPQESATALSKIVDGEVYPRSITPADGGLLFMSRSGDGKRIHGLGSGICMREDACLGGEAEQVELAGESVFLRTGDLDHANAVVIRSLLPWTAPKLIPEGASVGLGDRLGVATPGHVKAVRGTGIFPVFAQQSIREMARTGRTPEDVMDDATFGVLQEGYRDGYGADADHLKTEADIDRCLEAGFRLFTIDPGDHVVSAADRFDEAELAAAYEDLPWGDLEIGPGDLLDSHAGRTLDLGGADPLRPTEAQIRRAAVKYGRALAHVAGCWRYLCAYGPAEGFQLEVSVDETESPTTPEEHLFVARELARLGVKATSLAPRFVGRFEKGVDYIGDLAEFERAFARHAAIAEAHGYKLSIHSGSDKFSIYPVMARYATGRIHLKTAGTSYLEALHAISRIDPPFFREVLGFARERYETDRRSYHVSGERANVPDPESVGDGALAEALAQFDARQMLHVTYGSVLEATGEDGEPRFRDRLMELLLQYEEAHHACLEMHLRQHIQPFRS
jgi:hypothetical protein